LAAYIEAIEAWNPTHGLVGAAGDELVVKHVLDSLAPLPVLDGILSACPMAATGGRPRLADLGTGAGLPGIPLALARPGIDVCLIDRMTRRIRFLEAMRAALPLDNICIVEEQVEHLRMAGRFDVVTFRAFRPFERKLFKRVFSLCVPGGRVVAYKGKADRASAELSEVAGLYASAHIVPVRVPFLEDERCVVVLEPARHPV